MGQVLYTSDLPRIQMVFDISLSAGPQHGCKILHALFCHLPWKILPAETY